MNRAIKYRIYPTTEQKELMAKTFGCCRKIWNLMLADKVASYQASGSFGKQTPAMYKQSYPFLKEVDSLALANVQLQLQKAIKNCFTSGFGFPKFKSRHRDKHSYTTNNQGKTIILGKNNIRLPKIGLVKAVLHRLPKPDWILKSATISMDPDGKYYVSVLFEYTAKINRTFGSETLGIDYKSDGLYADSEGHVAHMPKYYRQSQDKLAKAQRVLSRRYGARKGEIPSANYKKQQRKVARIHRKIANQRKDYLHKLSTEIANQYDLVCVENLNMKAMANKGFGNGKATLDNGYGMFLNMLAYKLEERGKQLVQIDKWYPSTQICSCCGGRKPMLLSERVYHCICGMRLDRDLNAAINIKKEGLRLLEETA